MTTGAYETGGLAHLDGRSDQPSPFVARRLIVACVLPGTVLLGLCGWFQTRNSLTVDEVFYLTAAKQVFTYGNFMPLDYGGVAHLPVVLGYGPAIALRGELVPDHPSATDHDPATIAIARWTQVIVVGVPLLVVVVLWTYFRSRNVWASAAAGALTALSPTVVAHASLATTDATFTLFYLLALAGLGWFATCPTGRRLLVAGGLIGLAVASKYGAVLLFPVAFALGVVADWGPERADRSVSRRLLRLITVHPARVAGLGLVGVLSAWAVTGFQVYTNPVGGKWVGKVFGTGAVGQAVSRVIVGAPMPSPVMGFVNQTISARPAPEYNMMPTSLFGQSHPRGHRLYYICAVPAKSTPAELALELLTLTIAFRLVWRFRNHSGDLNSVALVMGVGFLFVVCSASPKQFGVRYVLPVYPAVSILGVCALTTLVRRSSTLGVTLVLLVGWQGLSVIATGPRWVSYVNSLAGGPQRAHEMFGHADVDIGQGAYDLRDFLSARGETSVISHLTGPTKVTAYGLQAAEWEPDPPCRYVAIGQMSMTFDPRYEPHLAPFRSPLPRQLVGESIYVYDTTNPEVLVAYRTAARIRSQTQKPDPDP